MQEIEIKLNKEEQSIAMDVLLTELNNVNVALAQLKAINATNNGTYEMFKRRKTLLKKIIEKVGRD